jgi:hypothetical protein
MSVIALFLMFFLSSSKVVHPFYISMTEVKIDTLQKTVAISCRMFTDDLQQELYKTHQLKKEIKAGDAAIDAILSDYVKTNFKVLLGNEMVTFKFIGFEIEDESTWAYFEGNYNKNSRKITLKNSLLYGTQPGQNNMMHCYLQSERKSNKLNFPKTESVFEF